MNIISIAISLFVLLFAITIHEAAHGWMASKFGDDTARSMGRVTLNPMAHIDPIGTVLLPILLVIMGAPVFGWAKPVPVNPFNLRNPRHDNLWISAAGPLANVLAAALSLFAIVLIKGLSPGASTFLLNFLTGRGGSAGGIQPLEGLALIFFYGALVNSYLVVFNLIPVPPLDGSGILMGLLSEEAAEKYDRLRPYGFLIVLGLIYLGVLSVIIRPIQILIFTIVFA
ncbi:MAG: site-2 protease family protein [Candidatus Aminicenantes bacterium]|nr:site-2 protease family protein [Candidatus Aminicenantes bacterium]